jgi:hypothetical protein
MIRNFLILVFFFLLVLFSCRNEPPVIPSETGPKILFVSPANNDTVLAPFYIQYRIENRSGRYEDFKIEVFKNDSLLKIHNSQSDSILIEDSGSGLAIWKLRLMISQGNVPEDSAIARFSAIENSFRLQISNGLGTGFYRKDDTINIKANDYIGLNFEKWNGDVQFVNDRFIPSASVIMPPRNIDLTPEYTIQDTVYFFTDVQPIFEASCTLPDCHDTGERIANLTDTAEIKFYAPLIKDNVASGFMPTRGELTNEEKNTIIAWINQGFKFYR